MVCHGESQDDSKSRSLQQKARRLATLTEWFAELDAGNYPLLNTWERHVAEEVYSEAKIAATSSDLQPCEDADDIAEKISILEDNLRLIIRRLRTYKGDRQEFVREFLKWHLVRRRNVEALKTVGRSMHTDRRKCNVSRLVGNCTSFVGGGICVASAALIPFTLGLSTPVFIAGAATTALGSSLSVGTSITELALLKKKVAEAKAVIEEDKSSFKSLENWLVSASDLSEARDAILTIDVDEKISNILQTIHKSFSAAVAMCSTPQRILCIRKLVNTIILSVPAEYAVIAVIPSLTALLLVLALILYNNSSVFDDASSTLKTITSRFSSIATIPLGILQPAVGAFVKTEVSVAGSVAKAVAARGLIAALGMSIDAASIILTSIDVSKGSVSEEGKKITEAADKMQEEAEVLEKVYVELVSASY